MSRDRDEVTCDLDVADPEVRRLHAYPLTIGAAVVGVGLLGLDVTDSANRNRTCRAEVPHRRPPEHA